MLNIPYGKPTFGFGDIEDSGDFFVYYVEPLSSQCIRVWFSNEVVKNTASLEKSNYSITSGMGVLPVDAVIPTSYEVTSGILLHIKPQIENVPYTITVSNVIDRSGAPLLFNTSLWTYNKTKCDAMLTSMPSMYDKSPDSYLYKLINSISYADNLIGGVVTEIPEE